MHNYAFVCKCVCAFTVYECTCVFQEEYFLPTHLGGASNDVRKEGGAAGRGGILCTRRITGLAGGDSHSVAIDNIGNVSVFCRKKRSVDFYEKRVKLHVNVYA